MRHLLIEERQAGVYRISNSGAVDVMGKNLENVLRGAMEDAGVPGFAGQTAQVLQGLMGKVEDVTWNHSAVTE